METASTSIKFGKKDFVGKFEGVFLDNYDVLKQIGKRRLRKSLRSNE